ncbi:PepSY-associated TM helix domain-containing protein [Mycolicibacterium elephantis]
MAMTGTSGHPGASAEEAEPVQRRERWRPFVLRLHFYAGIFVGPFLLVAAVSGGLYAIAPTLEQFAYHDHLYSDSAGEPRPVADQIRAAQERLPELTVSAVRPAPGPGQTTRVLFDDPALGTSERHAVFVDPVTATTRGELIVYGNSSALPLRTWIDRLHRDLHLGDPGRLYSELAASWLWLIALGGVVLWVTRYLRRTGRSDCRPRLLVVERFSRGRARTLNWHGVVGIWITAGLLFLSATGLTWSKYAGENIADLRTALSWTTPAVSTALEYADGAEQPGEARVGDIDRVLAAARAAGVDGPVEVGIPADAGTAFTVVEIRQPWVISNNAAAVDGSTGRVTETLWFADWPLAAKLAAWGIQLHMGLLFGLANQLVLVALAAALATVIVRGYQLWWRRRPTRGGPPVGRPPVGRPPRRGVLRDLSPAGVAVVIVIAVVAGWFVPLFGLSLVGFVVVDVVVGMVSRRAADTAGT